jgi:hypothetical protein
MKKYHEVQSVEVKNGILNMIVDEISISTALKDISPRLAMATIVEQSEFEVSPSGYGIHWPLVDEDISIDGLLGIFHHMKQQERLRLLRK